MNQLQMIGALELGLLYSFVSCGIYITFRSIRFPDLTVDGSFTLGGATSAALMLAGVDPYIATVAALLAGAFAGFITGYFHVKVGILGLLAGILTMTGLSSINLRVMGRPNLALMYLPTVFGAYSPLFVFLGITCVLVLSLSWFFTSNLGLSIRGIGTNPQVSRAYGIRVGNRTILTIMLSNAFVALAGSLFAQLSGFAGCSMGLGTLVVGLASLIVGEVTGMTRRVSGALLSCVFGSIVYRIVIMLALNSDDIGLEASDLNLITALVIALTMSIPMLKRKILCWHSKISR